MAAVSSTYHAACVSRFTALHCTDRGRENEHAALAAAATEDTDATAFFEEEGGAPTVLATAAVVYSARDELKIYLDSTAQPVPAGTAPLEYWSRAEVTARLPILSYMARKFLCIMTASTPCERLFSMAGESMPVAAGTDIT